MPTTKEAALRLALAEIETQKSLRSLALARLVDTTRQRDLLAIRCAEQARQIATLMTGGARLTVTASEAVEALFARFDEDGGLTREAAADVLVGLGARA